MGFRLTKVTPFTCTTPDEVRQHAIKLKGYGGTECEREDKAVRKRRIKAKVLGDEMTLFRWAVGHVLTTGLRRRANGQHSSEVLLELTPEEWAKVRFPIVIVWEEYDCDTIRDLPVLFEQFDPQWSNRDGNDIMGAHLGIHEDLHAAGIKGRLALIVANGIVWHRHSVEGLNMPKEAKYQIIHENHDTHAFLTWCGSFLQKGKTEEMHGCTVIAAMYRTAKDDASRAFWKRVAGGKVVNEEDTVEFKLVVFLEMCRDKQAEWPRSVSKSFRLGSNTPTDLDIFATCLRAFSAWRKGTKDSDIVVSAKGKKAAQIAQDFPDVADAA